LVEVFSRLKTPLLIAGKVESGAQDYFAELRRKSTPNIKWLGEQDIKGFLPKLDVFAMISEPAGCPNASLEALLSGLPLIITDVGGANEQVLPAKNGWLVAARDATAFMAAVQQAESMPAAQLRRMAKNSITHAKKFSIERMLKAYLRLIKSVTKSI
jgi:glycosyltransferase involved in cell wall biosynthesis